MYLTDKGTAYSDGFYTIENGRVINPFTNRTLGLIVRTLPSSNYLCLRELTLWEKITSWFVEHQEIHDRREIDYSKAKPGSIKETMKGLEK